MALEVPHLKRSLLGYRRSSVEKAIAEREDLYHEAVRDKGDLAAKLHDALEERDRLRRELDAATTELEQTKAELETAKGVVAELGTKLEAAEAQLEEREQARATLAQQLEAERGATKDAGERAAAATSDAGVQREIATAAMDRADRAEERAMAAEATAARLTRELADVSAELETARAESRIAAGESSAERGRADRLDAEVGRLREELRRASASRDEATLPSAPASPVDRPVAVAEAPASTEPVSSGDIAAALEMAEQAMERIVGEGRRRLEDEVESLERRRDDVANDLASLEQRIARLVAASTDVTSAVREARETIDGVETAIGTALEPLLGSLSAVDRGMSTFEEVADEAGPLAPRRPTEEPSADEGGGDDERPDAEGSASGEGPARFPGGSVRWLPRRDDQAG